MTTHTVSEKSTRRPAGRRSTRILGLLALATIAAIIFLALRWDNINAVPTAEPAGEVDLFSQAYEGEPLLIFTLAQPKLTAIHYALENVDTPFLDLTLTADDGSSWVVLRSQGLRTDSLGGGTRRSARPRPAAAPRRRRPAAARPG